MSDLSKFVESARGLVTLALKRPGDLRHVLGTARHALNQVQDPATDIRGIPAVGMRELLDGREMQIVLHLFPAGVAAISTPEAHALALLMRRVAAKNAFEFGTYKGVSTTQLALNLEPGGTVYTLDLPESDKPAYALEITAEKERMLAQESRKGEFVPHSLRDRIVFLAQDSAQFDPAPYLEKMDLVFVDGAHSAAYVKNDTEKAWRMLRPGGVVLWHDCLPNHPDVVRSVRASGLPIRRIEGTSLAFAFKP